MKKNKKKLILTVILLIAVIVGVIYFRPLSLEKRVLSDSELSIMCTNFTVKDGKAVNETSTRDIEPGTEEYDELKAILEKYSYHRNFKSLIKSKGINSSAGNIYSISIIDKSSNEITSINLWGAKKFYIDERSYNIDYIGDKKYKEFVQEFTEWYYNK